MGSSNTQERRIHNRIGIAREGFPFAGIGLAITLLFLFLNVVSLAIVAGAFTLFIVYFFRDPNRESEVQERAVFTPADGKVLGAWTLESGETPVGTRIVKVSVFMSLFDVHVNRIPTGGRISKISYRPALSFSLRTSTRLRKKRAKCRHPGHPGRKADRFCSDRRPDRTTYCVLGPRGG